MAKLEVFRDDKFYLILPSSGIYQVHGVVNGKRIRKSCDTRSLEQAKCFLDSVAREYFSGWRAGTDDPHNAWKDIARLICERHRGSARSRGMIFDLRSSDVYAMMRATGFRCAVSGVPFSKDSNKRDPWAPSIDRIENRQGYTLDNVRVVCLAANIAMSDWGHDVLLRLAKGVVRSAERVSAEPELSKCTQTDIAMSGQVIEFAKQSGR